MEGCEQCEAYQFLSGELDGECAEHNAEYQQEDAERAAAIEMKEDNDG